MKTLQSSLFIILIICQMRWGLENYDEMSEADEMDYGGPTHTVESVTETSESAQKTTDSNKHSQIFITAKTPEKQGKIDRSKVFKDRIIELNVGGQRITTLLSTLTAVPESKLAEMFNETNTKDETLLKDNTGAIFFDYHPKHFQYLLDQLRTIRRMPRRSIFDIEFKVPTDDIQSKFSHMIVDLGFNHERFLFPLAGIYQNLIVSSLVGWKECHRSQYSEPFNMNVLIKVCNGSRLMAACRPVGQGKMLTLAGVGKRSEIFRPCVPNSHCTTSVNNDIGFYYAENSAWGFEGRSKYNGLATLQNNYPPIPYYSSGFYLGPCDQSDFFSDNRLCWSSRTATHRGGGDRCGSVKNLHNETGWERIIYQAV